MVASPCPLRERLFPAGHEYQRKATVGYQSAPRCGFTGVDERPWTNACAAPGYRHAVVREAAMTRPDTASHLHPRVTSYRSRHPSVSSGQQETWDRLWPELGTHARSAGGPRRAARHREVVRQVRTGGAGDRQRYRHLDAGDGARPNRISMWSRSRCTGAAWPSCSARSTREGVTNIRLVRGDGVDVLEHMFGS